MLRYLTMLTFKEKNCVSGYVGLVDWLSSLFDFHVHVSIANGGFLTNFFSASLVIYLFFLRTGLNRVPSGWTRPKAGHDIRWGACQAAHEGRAAQAPDQGRESRAPLSSWEVWVLALHHREAWSPFQGWGARNPVSSHWPRDASGPFHPQPRAALSRPCLRLCRAGGLSLGSGSTGSRGLGLRRGRVRRFRSFKFRLELAEIEMILFCGVYIIIPLTIEKIFALSFCEKNLSFHNVIHTRTIISDPKLSDVHLTWSDMPT